MKHSFNYKKSITSTVFIILNQVPEPIHKRTHARTHARTRTHTHTHTHTHMLERMPIEV